MYALQGQNGVKLLSITHEHFIFSFNRYFLLKNVVIFNFKIFGTDRYNLKCFK